MAKNRKGDPISNGWAELHPLLEAVNMSLEAIGQKLWELEQRDGVGAGGVLSLIKQSQRVSHLHQATLIVWWRIAKGDLPREIKETEITDSVLANMTEGVAQRIVDGEEAQIVAGGDHPRLVTKPIKEFTREENTQYMTPHGPRAVDDEYKEGPLQRVRATGADWNEEGDVLEVAIGSMRLKVLISRDMMEPIPMAVVAEPAMV
jgi:hypothetical protein